MRVRLVIQRGADTDIEFANRIAKARRERALHMKRLRERKPQAIARKAAYAKKAWKERDAEAERERKRKWREENREHYNAYFRKYDELTPGRREYKARWLRERSASV